ncbi:hypothetical protein F5X96DRAFT_670495 [Biscogniauxia mediterranea]|nr:hypothetical protein F5X96DRAFT_670495 [Biscogniauxia mediterranea]
MLEPAREAFIIAVAKFSTSLTSDPQKVKFVSKATEISDLQKIVAEAKSKYEAKNEKNTVIKWLRKFSKRVVHYGTILDVLVSYHHEYVALVWGATKFLFVITDTLPVVEATILLFPTDRMKLALAEIYASVIRFLVRVQDWFEENRFLRVLHSIKRPKEQRYDDLLEDIESSTSYFRNLAVTESQAERRDVHLLLLEMKQMMILHQQINSSAQLNTNTALTDLEFSQILTFLSNSPIEGPDKAFNTTLFLRNRNRRNAKAKCEPFWLSPNFQAWAQSQKSTLIMVKGNFGSRQDQGLPPTELSLALSCTRFQTARKANEWFDIQAASLADLKQIYVAVDVKLLELVLSNESDGLSLPDAFSKTLRRTEDEVAENCRQGRVG